MLGQTDYNAKLLLDIASLFSLRQLIDTPTCLTCNSATILDLVFVSSSINVHECGVSDAISVSDHLIIYATLAVSRPRRPGRVSLSRNIHAIRPEDTEYQLGLIDWSPIYAASHVDEMVSHFTASLTAVFDRLAPITCIRVSRPPAP